MGKPNGNCACQHNGRNGDPCNVSPWEHCAVCGLNTCKKHGRIFPHNQDIIICRKCGDEEYEGKIVIIIDENVIRIVRNNGKKLRRLTHA